MPERATATRDDGMMEAEFDLQIAEIPLSVAASTDWPADRGFLPELSKKATGLFPLA